PGAAPKSTSATSADSGSTFATSDILDSGPMDLDRETEQRIEQPVSAEAERETRLTPAEAVAQMRINVPVRGNRKLQQILEHVNHDAQLKAWWHAANVNAVARMRIND